MADKKLNNKTPKILVVFHIYYNNQADYFIEKLKNIKNCIYSLYVTIVNHDESLENKLREFAPNVEIRQVPNLGYDIAPFLEAIRSIDLSAFDYVLKLHTKGSRPDDLYSQDIYVGGYNWRDSLVDSLIGNVDTFNANMAIMDSRPKTGIIASRDFVFPCNKGQKKNELSSVYREAKHIFGHQEIRPFWYVAGTIFLCRSEILQRLQSDNISSEDFEKPLGTGMGDFSKAHLYERLLGLMTYIQGYVITGVNYVQLDFSASPEMLIGGKIIPENMSKKKMELKILKLKKYRNIYIILFFTILLLLIISLYINNK